MSDGAGIRYFLPEHGGDLLFVVHQVDAVNNEKLRLVGVLVRPERVFLVNGAIDDCRNPSEGMSCNGILRKKFIDDAPADQAGSAHDNSVILSHVSRECRY